MTTQGPTELVEDLLDDLIEAARQVEWGTHFGSRWGRDKDDLAEAKERVRATIESQQRLIERMREALVRADEAEKVGKNADYIVSQIVRPTLRALTPSKDEPNA